MTSAGPLDLTSPSFRVTGLRYRGLTTVLVSGSSVRVMRFSLATATWDSLQLGTGCRQGERFVTSSGAGSASDGMTLDAISLAATVNGSVASYSVSSPPNGEVLPGGDGELADMSATVALLDAPLLELGSPVTGSRACP